MKHRRIVSDTSALNLPLSLTQQQQQQQPQPVQGSDVSAQTTISQLDDSLNWYVATPDIVIVKLLHNVCISLNSISQRHMAHIIF